MSLANLIGTRDTHIQTQILLSVALQGQLFCMPGSVVSRLVFRPSANLFPSETASVNCA